MYNLTRLNQALAEWEGEKADAETRLAELRSTMLAAALRGETHDFMSAITYDVREAETRLTIAQWHVVGIQGAIDYERGVQAGTINLSDGRDTDDLIDDLRLELLR